MFKPEPFGNYLLIEKVSVGGMAEVFKALMIGTEGFQKLVAIKRLLPSVAEDEEFARMFIDEANIAGQLHHANIAQVYDLGRIEEHYFIAMEYVQGRDLRAVFDRLKRIKRGVPLNMAVYIVAKACEGLDYAHRKKDAQGRPLNIVHRDISPPNILLSYEGDVKIVDFGIAKATKKLTQTQAGILKGKFGYMSPEQVRGLPIDRRSDIFSIGIVLYEMITGRRLFVGTSDFNTLEKVRSAEIKPPSELNPHVPPALEAAVMKALERDVSKRYQWASEFQADLQRYLYTQEHPYNRQDLSEFMSDIFSEDIEAERKRMEELERMDISSLVNAASSASYQSLKTDDIKPLPEKQEHYYVDTKGNKVSPEQALVLDVDDTSEPIRLVTDPDTSSRRVATSTANTGMVQQAHVTQQVQREATHATGPIHRGRHDSGEYNYKPRVAQKNLEEEEFVKPEIKPFAVPPIKKSAFLATIGGMFLIFLVIALYMFFRNPYPEYLTHAPLGSKVAKVFFLSNSKDAAVQLTPISEGKEQQRLMFSVCPETPCYVPDIIAGTYRVEFRRPNGVFYSIQKYTFEPDKTYYIPARFAEPGSKTGILLLTSDPEGATFKLSKGKNEIAHGETPRKIKHVPAGEKLSLTISYPGYKYEVRDVFVNPYDVEKIDVKLKPAESVLKVSSTPAGAKVLINGKDTGKLTPAEFPNLDVGKEYAVTLEYRGKRIEKKILITGGFDTVSVNFDSSKQKETATNKGSSGAKKKESSASASASSYGWVKVSSSPNKVKFKIGKKKGKTPAKIKLKPGRYELKVIVNEFVGLDLSCANFTVKSGKTTRCRIKNTSGAWTCSCKR